MKIFGKTNVHLNKKNSSISIISRMNYSMSKTIMKN